MAPEIRALIDGSRDAVRRVIADLREKAETAEQLRVAEHRAFMAEQREAVAVMLRAADERIASFRDGIDGKDGLPGRDGVDGEQGPQGKDGRDGVDGKDGLDGPPGRDGVDGRNGEPGRDGNDGAPGEAGRDGVDGRDGANGVDGAAGRDGSDGVAGKDGHNGLTAEDIDVTMMEDGRTLRLAFAKDDTEYAFQVPFAVPLDRGAYAVGKTYQPADIVTLDGRMWIAERATSAAPDTEQSGWRLAVERGTDGADGAAGQDAYAGEARGLFDPEARYRKNDTVSFNGSEWRAKIDAPGDLPGEGWMLSASRGKRGDRGERGLQGQDGEPGKDGSSLVAAFVDTKDLQLTLTRDDGVELTADLYDLAQVIRG